MRLQNVYQLSYNKPSSFSVPTEGGKLAIGFIPTKKAQELTPMAQEFEKYLESKFNGSIDVEVLVPTLYDPLKEGLRFGIT